MRALLVFLLASLPYVAQAQEVDKVSAEGRGRCSITMNASGSLSILMDTTTARRGEYLSRRINHSLGGRYRGRTNCRRNRVVFAHWQDSGAR